MNKFFEKTQKNALISVYDKEGIVEFAQSLCTLGWTIYSSGGTAKFLANASLPVIDVGTMVGEPILGHRVVTISRELHAGLLADRLKPEDVNELASLGLPFFGIVCVDFYPLIDEVRNPKATINTVIEKTDIGGPLMVRSGAKGNRLVICDPKDRKDIIDLLSCDVATEDMIQIIYQLAAKAEAVVANYVLQSATYRGDHSYAGIVGEKILDVRYGENPWQKGYGLYKDMNASGDLLSVNHWQVIAGNPGHVNYTDVDRMLHMLTHIIAGFDKNDFGRVDIAIGVKHGNACGASFSLDGGSAIQSMLHGNLRSIFGGSVMTNFVIDEHHAHILREHMMSKGKRILDLVVAAGFTGEAIAILTRKGDACKMIAIPGLMEWASCKIAEEKLLRPVRGGFLLQDNFSYVPQLPSRDMVLGWAINATSDSNTITLVRNGKLIGNGVKQQDRVECCELAVKRAIDAGHTIQKTDFVEAATAVSDSFFPFTDGPEVLIKAGVRQILANSGSINDHLVKKFCEENGCQLLLHPNSEARGFFGH